MLHAKDFAPEEVLLDLGSGNKCEDHTKFLLYATTIRGKSTMTTLDKGNFGQ